MSKLTKWPRNDVRLRGVVTGFWFAVQRMIRRRDDQTGAAGWELPPDPDDDGLSGTGVRRHPPDASGSAGAEVPEPSRDSERH